MNDTTQNRFEVDLDEIERQLRRSAEAGAAAPVGAQLDPLAELARIVGQEDPFGSILGPTKQTPGSTSEPPASEPEEAAAEPIVGPAPVEAPVMPQPYDLRLTAEDRGVLGTGPEPHGERHAPSTAEIYDPVFNTYGSRDSTTELEEFAPLAPQRSRRRLAFAFGAIGLAAVGVAGGLALRQGGRFVSSGPPPLIKADNAPLKVPPENPGGMEIPDQNRQIYDKSADTGRSRVLDRQEQPIDVREAARSFPPSEAPPMPSAPRLSAQNGSAPGPTDRPPAAGQSAATQPPAPPAVSASPATPRASAQPNAVTSALGEPRRVRTVAVRPDGSAIGSPAGTLSPDPSAGLMSGGQLPPPVPVATISVPAVPPAPSPAPATPSATGPTDGTTPQAGTGVAVLPPHRPRSVGTAEGVAGDPVAGTAALRSAAPDGSTLPVTEQSSQGGGVSIKPPPRPNRRLAAAATPPTASVETSDAPDQTTAAPTNGRAYSVQIAVRPSEEAARAAYDQLADKFATDLGGKPATVTRAQVNGRAVYRVRVTPLSREDANTLCTRLKTSGGQCFVSAN